MMNDKNLKYTTQLQAGLGLVEETKSLLSIYHSGMTVSQLHEKALNSGLFPMVTARRLRNIIAECFYPRYLKTDSAKYLKLLSHILPSYAFNQFLLVFTALANQILMDFITEIYWIKYSSGQDTISTDDAKEFVEHAVREGRTQKVWSETTIKRVSSYLIGCCTDYGMLSSNRSSIRQIQSNRLQEYTLLFFSYWLHFQGQGDNSVVAHRIWRIFGLEPSDVRDELKRISKKGWLIVQSAGDVTRLSWSYTSLEEVIDVIIKR